MNTFTRMQDLDMQGKTVFIRQDLNVPIKGGIITSDARLQASLPTIKQALGKGAGVIIASHLGRPTEGTWTDKFSLRPIADYLTQALGQKVALHTDIDTPLKLNQGEVVLLDNVRFNVGEKSNDPNLSAKYADMADVFIMDAFGTAHRAQASTHGVFKTAKQAGKVIAAGPLLAQELDALAKALDNPAKPMLAIVGGSKVSTKLDVLNSLAQICDQLIVGGGIANTFLAAQGHDVGESLYEPDLLDTAKHIMSKTQVLLPSHVVVSPKSAIDFADFIGSLKQAPSQTKVVTDIANDEMILDIAPNSAKMMADAIKHAKTVLWNGPVGVFEVPAFAQGTQIIAQAVKDSNAYSIAGGGDTLAAIDAFGVVDGVSYQSTGGGAFLEFVEGKTLPAVAVLTE